MYVLAIFLQPNAKNLISILPSLCTLYNISDSTEVELRDFPPFISSSSERIWDERNVETFSQFFKVQLVAGKLMKRRKFVHRGKRCKHVLQPTGG